MTIDEYEKQARVDLNFEDITKLDVYCIFLGAKIARWAKWKYDEEQTLNSYTQALNKLYREVYQKFVYDNTYEGKEFNYSVDKKNIDIFLKTDKTYQTGEKVLSEQTEKIDFIETIINTLSNQSYLLNTALKARMYASGDIDK